MAKEVKIIWIYKGLGGVGQPTAQAEQEIAELLDQGWVIAGAGGGGSGADSKSASGFVILVRDVR
jgi:hypothetical protein